MMLSMPAEATYLQDGYRSSAITDSLCPFNERINVGSYQLIKMGPVLLIFKSYQFLIVREIMVIGNCHFTPKMAMQYTWMIPELQIDDWLKFVLVFGTGQEEGLYQLFRQFKQTKVMKQNMSLGMNRPASCSKGVPKYSDKYKDVLERAQKREQVFKPKLKPIFFYRVRSIGVGAFSFVYLVTEQNSGTIFAQKSISKKSIAPELFTEIKMHLTLSHPNIVNLYHIYSEEGYVQLIMDYAGESLFALRKNNKLGTTVGSQMVTVSILKQLIQAVRYLHARKIVHADIKLENILYLEGVVKLCDFGYAHIRLNEEREGKNNRSPERENGGRIQSKEDIVGTFQYLDPQYVQGKHSEFSRDIWAIGIVAYELSIGRNPFQGMAQNQKWSTILRINEIDIKNVHVSASMHKFLEMTLCPIEKRATIQQLANFELFSKFHQHDEKLELSESHLFE